MVESRCAVVAILVAGKRAFWGSYYGRGTMRMRIGVCMLTRDEIISMAQEAGFKTTKYNT
jgi:hypothetical protein